MYKGAIHIHSTYSDGELTLSELRRAYEAAGCAFVCMTDHAEYFDSDRLQQYVAECAALSGGGFRFVPGLEFRCPEKLHVLGLGVVSRPPSDDPREVIAHIERRGGISIVAHPRARAFAAIEAFDLLPDGIETWNTKYDGRYAPRTGTFDLLGRLQRRRPGMKAFYGQDYHWRRQYRGLFVEVAASRGTSAGILEALARGDYVARHGEAELPADGRLPAALRRRFGAVHPWSDAIRWVAATGKTLADRLGVPVTAPLKARLRGIF
jgi:PHP domain